MGDFEKVVDAIIDCVKGVEADELVKLKITYTLLKIYQSEENLDNVCLTLDKNKKTKTLTIGG